MAMVTGGDRFLVLRTYPTKPGHTKHLCLSTLAWPLTLFGLEKDILTTFLSPLRFPIAITIAARILRQRNKSSNNRWTSSEQIGMVFGLRREALASFRMYSAPLPSAQAAARTPGGL